MGLNRVKISVDDLKARSEALNKNKESSQDHLNYLLDELGLQFDDMVSNDDLPRIDVVIHWLGQVFQKLEPHRERLIENQRNIADKNAPGYSVEKDESCTESSFCGLCPPSESPDPSINNILQEAQKIVDGQRRKDYGDMRASFKRIGAMWSAYLDAEVNMFDVAHMMIMLKLSRNHDRYNKDSMIDVAGYAYCADRIHDDELAEKSKFNGEF